MRKALATLALAALIAPAPANASNDLLSEYFTHVFKPCAEVIHGEKSTDQQAVALWDLMLSEGFAEETYRATAHTTKLNTNMRTVMYARWQIQCIFRYYAPQEAIQAVHKLLHRHGCASAGAALGESVASIEKCAKISK